MVEIPSKSDPQKKYILSLPPWERKEEEIVCQCEGFDFRGFCSHQKEALRKVCDWNEFSETKQTKEQKHDKICPICLGPTRMVLE